MQLWEKLFAQTVEEGGGEYVGVTDVEFDYRLVFFNNPETKSTLALKVSADNILTAERVRDHIKENTMLFKEIAGTR